MCQMVGVLAELEWSLIQERTKAGRAAAMARGVRMGRKPLLSEQQATHAWKLIEQGESPEHVAKSLKVSLYRRYPYLVGQPTTRQFVGNCPVMKNGERSLIVELYRNATITYATGIPTTAIECSVP